MTLSTIKYLILSTTRYMIVSNIKCVVVNSIQKYQKIFLTYIVANCNKCPPTSIVCSVNIEVYR